MDCFASRIADVGPRRVAQDSFEAVQQKSFCVKMSILHFVDDSLSTSSDLPNDAPAPAIHPHIVVRHQPMLIGSGQDFHLGCLEIGDLHRNTDRSIRIDPMPTTSQGRGRMPRIRIRVVAVLLLRHRIGWLRLPESRQVLRTLCFGLNAGT